MNVIQRLLNIHEFVWKISHFLSTVLCLLTVTTLCLGKKTKMFFVISSTKLGQFRWNLVHRFLNKFAAKSCKRFPLHLNNVSTLPCETWNAHCTRATTALSEKITQKFIQLWIQLITACGNIAREGVQNTHHWYTSGLLKQQTYHCQGSKER